MDPNQPSPLDTLRQLKEMLDAGAITPQEFATLKQKLLFPDAAPASPAADPLLPPPTAPVAVPPPTPAPTEAPVPSLPLAPVSDSIAPQVPLVPLEATVPPPVEDPLLPPVAASAGTPPLEPVVLDPVTHRPTEGPIGGPNQYPDEPADEPRSSPLGPILIIGGVLVLLAIIGYLVLGTRDSERITSSSMTPADTTGVVVEEGPQAEQLELPPVQAPETVRVQPNIPPGALATDTATAPGTSPADAAATEAANRANAQRTLTALYADLQAAPFNAGQYFASQVERFLQLQNTTPDAINDDLTQTHFPEFTEGKYSIVPGTMQVSAPAEDGSVTVTYQERGRALRKSLNQYQQTLAQVRARFDNTGKLTYFRQERLLENKFIDAKPATTPAPAEAPAPQE